MQSKIHFVASRKGLEVLYSEAATEMHILDADLPDVLWSIEDGQDIRNLETDLGNDTNTQTFFHYIS